jgi:hypothetical protein
MAGSTMFSGTMFVQPFARIEVLNAAAVRHEVKRVREERDFVEVNTEVCRIINTAPE